MVKNRMLRLVGVLVWVTGVTAHGKHAPGTYRDPERFEERIAKYEAEDAKSFPPESAVLCIGSSSMGGWHNTIREDLAPLTVIPRGFGGSNMNDVVHFANRVVLPYKPRAILLYEGDNDIALGVSPDTVMARFETLVGMVHAKLPDTRFYVLSVKPSIRRWEMWPAMSKTNKLMEARCATDKRLTYVDVATPMLNEKGEPMSDIFKEDNLHMVRKGYEIWRDAVRPVLVEAEMKFEPGDWGSAMERR